MGKWLYYNIAVGRFYTKKLCSRLYSTESEFYPKTQKIAFEPPFMKHRGNVCTPSIALWKARSQLRHNWAFCYLLRLTRYKRKSGEVGIFRRERVTLNANFRRKVASPANYCWCQKTRVIALSCGVKMVCGRFGPRLWCGQETVRSPAAAGVHDAMRSGQASVRRRRTARRQRQVGLQCTVKLYTES